MALTKKNLCRFLVPDILQAGCPFCHPTNSI